MPGVLGISFAFPAVLWAGAAAAAPVIIHLIMRTKPRRLVFPALRFVKLTHQANRSKLKLKHLILLAMRMAAIVLIAMLIARALMPEAMQVEQRRAPTAMVIVLDNSGSMGYEHRGRTLLEEAKRSAGQIVERFGKMPAGSRIAVLPTSEATETPEFIGDARLAAQQLADVPQQLDVHRVDNAVRRARAMLEGIDLPRRELYVLTDMTRRAFGAEPAPEVAGEPVSLYVIDLGGGKDANLALGPVELSSRSVPVGGTVRIETVLSSRTQGGEIPVRAELGGTLLFQRTVELPAGGQTPISLTVTPKEEGILHGRVLLGRDDPLAMDNVRHFTLDVRPPTDVLLLREPGSDRTRFRMALAIAPDAVLSGTGPIRPRTLIAERLTPDALRGAAVVVLADVSSLTEGPWRMLGDYVRDGGQLWVVAGETMANAVGSYNSPPAQDLLPASLKALEPLKTPIGFDLRDLDHPMVSPFTSPENPSLGEVRIKARFSIDSLAEEAVAALKYADGVPAILIRRVGRGRVLLWNFSPERSFSNLAGLAQFPVLAQRAVRLMTAGREQELIVRWGGEVRIPVPPRMTGPGIALYRPDSEREETLMPEGRSVRVVAEALGSYTLRFIQDERTVTRGFSVNTNPTESDLTPLEPEVLSERLGGAEATLVSSVDALAETREMVGKDLALGPLLLVGLLVLLAGESFFANRFYKQAEETAMPPRRLNRDEVASDEGAAA